MVMENDRTPAPNLESRQPGIEDLVELCRQLNKAGARYVVVGGFAMRNAGYVRQTMDIDLVVAADQANESRVFQALATLPDQAVKELEPGELERYTVVRVADEIVVDLMTKAGGIDYEEAARELVIREIQGVQIPFASPQLLWRMKAVTHREKDSLDLLFLREWFASRGLPTPGS